MQERAPDELQSYFQAGTGDTGLFSTFVTLGVGYAGVALLASLGYVHKH